MCLLSFATLIKSQLLKKLLEEEEKIIFRFVSGASPEEEDVNLTLTGSTMKSLIILWSIWMLRRILMLEGPVNPSTKQDISVYGGGTLARALKGLVPSFLNVPNTQVVFMKSSQTWNSPLT